MVHLPHTPIGTAQSLSSEERRFWMLMAECERLLDEEAVAIRKRDITYLEDLIIRKEAVVSALAALESILDKKRPDAPESHMRMKTLQAAHETNLTGIDTLLNDLHAQKRKHTREKAQGKAILGTYYGDISSTTHKFVSLG